MAIVFDTSILIAGFVASHPKHKEVLPWIQRARAQELEWAVSAHSILECYAVLTRLPLSPRLSPSLAKIILEENVEKSAKVISLSADDYFSLMKNAANLGLTGGIVYDAIILQSAKKIKAKGILTLNMKDFQRLSLEDSDFIISV